MCQKGLSASLSTSCDPCTPAVATHTCDIPQHFSGATNAHWGYRSLCHPREWGPRKIHVDQLPDAAKHPRPRRHNVKPATSPGCCHISGQGERSGERRACDPGQHGLQDLCAGAPHDDAHQVLLLFCCKVLREQRPQLLLLRAHLQARSQSAGVCCMVMTVHPEGGPPVELGGRGLHGAACAVCRGHPGCARHSVLDSARCLREQLQCTAARLAARAGRDSRSLDAHMLLQGGARGGGQALQCGGVALRLRQAGARLDARQRLLAWMHHSQVSSAADTAAVTACWHNQADGQPARSCTFPLWWLEQQQRRP